MYSYKLTGYRVIDGDTLEADLDLGFGLTFNTRLRLLGIDTPEIRTKDLEEKKKGMQAKLYLEGMLAGPAITTVMTEKSGKYGRWLATILVRKSPGIHTMNINEEMRKWMRTQT